jgi:hypothetical protein
VLTVANSGAGTLKVPAKDIGPFGEVSLQIMPIGKITSKSCQGTVVSKSIKVRLSGVFSFDSKSTGADAWGVIGSTKSFTFPATNTVTWSYSSAASENCIATTTPCGATVIWAAQHGAVAMDGTEAGAGGARVIASRAVSLATPKGATRSDSNIASTQGLVVKTGLGGSASLVVTGEGSGVTGSATLMSTAPSSPFPTPCGKGKTQDGEFWSGSYADGSTPLTVAEQIYGAFTLSDNDNGTFDQTTGG